MLKIHVDIGPLSMVFPADGLVISQGGMCKGLSLTPFELDSPMLEGYTPEHPATSFY